MKPSCDATEAGSGAGSAPEAGAAGPDEAAGSAGAEAGAADFIRRIVAADGDADSAAGPGAGPGTPPVTRFPPEPNGYLHVGHAKSMCLNFGVAAEFGGVCRLRFDDTNPAGESSEYAQAIVEDVRWLGFEWEGEPRRASDYFEAMYRCAQFFIVTGLAYVDSQSADEIRESRGTLTSPGRESPWRERPPWESLDLLGGMKAGEFPDGAHVLRARIDMASGNLNLRDPVLYRIRHALHPHTGDTWRIYPTYDFAQALSDAFEGVTHSLCTLEFEDHRPLYDWILDHVHGPPWGREDLGPLDLEDTRSPEDWRRDLRDWERWRNWWYDRWFPDQPERPEEMEEGDVPFPSRPRQIEFSRLSLEHTVMSKRRLAELVEGGHVDGWSDPRLPTLRGMRRRGYPPAAIRDFCSRVGVTRKESRIEMGLLESCVREELDRSAPRAMAVLRPLRLVIDNYPEGGSGGGDGEGEELEAANHPADPSFGSRPLFFGRELFIERDDFHPDPPPRYHRLAPGREVRLRYGYVVRCESFETDPATGEATLVRCTYDPATRGGRTPDGRKVWGTIHWVAAARALTAEVRLYDRLFAVPDPAGPEDLNPASVEVAADAKLEPSLAGARPGERFQFERLGYFCRDEDGGFNRTVALRDGWARRGG